MCLELCCVVLLSGFPASSLCQAPASGFLSIRSAPEHPIIELQSDRQLVNFDLIVENSSQQTWRISQIELDAYDKMHELVLRKSVNTDAFSPSIAVIGAQVLAPGGTLDIFNPFYEFGPAVSLDELKYSFCLVHESNLQEAEKNKHRLPDDCDMRQAGTVLPRQYDEKTALILPLRGRIFVWEGHDFYAHHLRVPLGSPKVQAMGITANSNEFASDFIYLDAQGRTHQDDARKLENWYGYGKPVYAPGSGVVLDAANDIPENSFEDAAGTKIGYPKLAPGKDPKDIGNFVLIDHEDGEYSLLVHMKPDSVAVKRGDRVKLGQQIGRIGFTGDSIFPHLHYSLMDGRELFKAWGLPAYFSDFRRVLGSRSVKASRDTVNSGDFLESYAVYSDAK